MKKYVKSASASTRTNNVKRICNYFQVGRPMFCDPSVYGYRVTLGALRRATKDQAEAEAVSDEIERELGITCRVRPRRGYGGMADYYDIIIPYADDDEVITYEYNRF